MVLNFGFHLDSSSIDRSDRYIFDLEIFSQHVTMRIWAMKIRIRRRSHYFGYRNGSIILINMDLAISCATTAWALCLMTPPN